MAELLILSRAVHFCACLVLPAVFAVRLLVERPAADDGRAARRLAGVCLVAAAGSGFGWFWAAAAGMNGSGLMTALNPQLFGLVLWQTPPGQVWIVRTGIALALGVVLCIPRGGWRWITGLVLAMGLLGSLAWLGHAGAGEDGRRAVMLTADVSHLLAASAWPAGLLPFALLLRRQLKEKTAAGAYASAQRFSVMSLFTVGTLVTSGLVNAFFLVGSFRALVTTDYGWFLTLKLLLVVAALALGAWNLLFHEPRMQTDPAATEGMLRKVWMEVALGTLIVSVVAILGTLAPGSVPGR